MPSRKHPLSLLRGLMVGPVEVVLEKLLVRVPIPDQIGGNGMEGFSKDFRIGARSVVP